jgi:hypothetical protein
VLDRRGAGRRADLSQEPLPGVAVLSHDPDLDELVGLQRASDLRHHRGRQAVGADEHDRVQAVGTAFERLALGGRKLFLHLGSFRRLILGR